MAYIEKRVGKNGKNSYRVRIKIKGAPKKTDTFPTRREAVKWGRQMEANIRANRYFGREESKERTFSEFVERYIKVQLPKNPRSFDKQSKQMQWWQKHLGSYFLCHISPSMISDLRDKLMAEFTPRKTLRSSSTANRYIAALSKAFTVAIREWGWLKENPVAKITRPREAKPKERYLEKEEINLLLDACKKSKSPHLYPVTLFALSTGARKGEILGLKWSDLDFSRNTATFRDTKNGEIRTMHLSPAILNCLQNEQKKRVVLSAYVFPNQNGKKPACIRTSWEQVIKDLGLKGVVFHTLRHTAASYLAMNGFSTLKIAEILGHKTLSMVKRYSHLSTSSIAKALDQMTEDILSGCV